MSFSLQDIVLLLVAIGNLALGGYVLLRNPRHVVHWSFFVFVCGFSLWMISLVLIFLSPSIILNQLIFYGGITALLGLFSLASTFPATKKLSKQFWLYTIPIAILYIGVPFNIFVSGITIDTNGIATPVLGQGFPLFLVAFATYAVVSFFVFTRRYRTVTGQEKQQMRFFMLGIFLFIFTVFIVNVLLPLFEIFEFNLIGAIASLAFTALTSYVIVRRRLFDLQTLLFRTISFINVLVLFALFLAVVLFAGVSLLFDVQVTAGQYIFGLVLMIAAMLTFQPLQQSIRRFTNKIFFHSLYDSQQLLSQLTNVMAATIDLNEITLQLLTIVKEQMHISKGAFLLVDKHRITEIKNLGYRRGALQASALEFLLHTRSIEAPYILYDDLQDKGLKELFRTLDISLAIPITVETNEVAILILGPKLSGEIYYQRDLNVLNIFAPQAGIAIQNAQSYSKIKRFSSHLEQMVDERTQQLKEAQERELEKAKAVTKLKDEFVFIAAHELRTPVTVIRGFLDLVENSGQKFSKDIHNYLTRIQSASNHLGQLVNDLLEVARSDAGTMKVEVSSVDIVAIAKDVQTEMSSLAKKSGVTIKLHTASNVLKARADTAKLKEVFVNLVSNAIKYNRPKGTIDIIASTENGFIRIDIQDTGYGIPHEQQKKIFQKFFRAESEYTQDIQGTGLGLFITRMLVEKMDGRIFFTSKEGVGTTFTFTLPSSE